MRGRGGEPGRRRVVAGDRLRAAVGRRQRQRDHRDRPEPHRAARALFEVAVDPSVIALGSYVHVQPNPFDTADAFYAGDTGAAILGRHVDIYDWHGRASQLAWGARTVTVTPAPSPGAGNLLGAVPATDRRAGRRDGGVRERDARSDRRADRDDRAGRQRARPGRRAGGGQARDRRRQPDPHPPLPHPRRPLRAALAAVAGV